MNYPQGCADAPLFSGVMPSVVLKSTKAVCLVMSIAVPFFQAQAQAQTQAQAQAQAKTLARSQLGDFALEFAKITVVDARRGQARLMRVTTLPGDGLDLHLPFSPNRIERLMADGARVEKGAPMARIYGPELEHWALELELLEERYSSARARYERNKTLYEQQSLSATAWQTILDRFHRLQMEHQHVTHILEWLEFEHGDGHGVTAVLRAPDAGYIMFEDKLEGPEPLIVRVLPLDALRLTMEVPRGEANAVTAFATPRCEKAVMHREARVSGFSRQLWSAPLSDDDCFPTTPELSLSGVPVYRFEGYTVPKIAVFGYRGTSYVALERGAELELAAVTIAGESPEGFYVASAQDLSGSRVLVRSTSAVQGLLLGLGED